MTTAELQRSGRSTSTASGSNTNEELRADADRLTETAKDRASEKVEQGTSQAPRTAGSASDALQKAAGELDRDDNAPSWLSSAFRETAKGIDQFAGKVEGRSPEQMGREISSFAREHPTSFLAASAAAGFAAARFLRAGADYKHHHDGRQTGYRDATLSTAGGQRSAGRFGDETRAAQQRYGESRESMNQ